MSIFARFRKLPAESQPLLTPAREEAEVAPLVARSLAAEPPLPPRSSAVLASSAARPAALPLPPPATIARDKPVFFPVVYDSKVLHYSAEYTGPVAKDGVPHGVGTLVFVDQTGRDGSNEFWILNGKFSHGEMFGRAKVSRLPVEGVAAGTLLGYVGEVIGSLHLIPTVGRRDRSNFVPTHPQLWNEPADPEAFVARILAEAGLTAYPTLA